MIQKKNSNRHIWLVAVFCMIIVGSGRTYAQHVALKTNALYWSTTTLNAGAEVKVAPKWTLALTAGYNPNYIKENNLTRCKSICYIL